jgi:NTP pyrophosphatase (non-canonical NTP hydrolase)
MTYNLGVYEDFIAATAQSMPGDTEQAKVEFCLTGMVEEVGEVFGKLKRVYRGDTSFEDQQGAFVVELGDAFWYFCTAAQLMGKPLGALMLEVVPQAFISTHIVELVDRVHYALACLNKGAADVNFFTAIAQDQKHTWHFTKTHALLPAFPWMLTLFIAVTETLGTHLGEVTAANVAKLEDRRSRGKTRGMGDNR